MPRRPLIPLLLVLFAGSGGAEDSLGELVLLRWQEAGQEHHAMLDLLADRVVFSFLDGPSVSWRREAADGDVLHGRSEDPQSPWPLLRASRRDGELLGQFLPAGPTWRGRMLGGAQEQLDEARSLQLQRDPWPALLLYTALWQRHPDRGDIGAPALVHAIEVLQSLAGSERATAVYADRYRASLGDGLPPLDGRGSIDTATARALLAAWQAERLSRAATGDPSAVAAKTPPTGEPVDETAPEPERPVKVGDWRLELTGLVGSRRRFVRSQQIERDEGEYFDAQASWRWRWKRPFASDRFGAGTATTIFGLTGGTDVQASEAATGMATVWGAHVIRTPSLLWPFNHYGLAVQAGHSEERGTLLEADLVLSLLHAGYEQDEDGHCFAYGIALGIGEEDGSHLYLSWNRLDDRSDDRDRHHATRVRLWGRHVFAGGVLLEGDLTYLRRAQLPGGREDNRWSTSLGVGWQHAW